VDARSGSWTCGGRRARCPWAAPHPHLGRTGARSPFSRLLAEDGTRAPIGCSAAEESSTPAVLAIPRATEPLSGCGADTCGLRQCTEIKSGHDTGRRQRQDPNKRKTRKYPRVGIVGLLTTGGLIRVRRGSGTMLRLWHHPLPATPSTAPSETKAVPHCLLNSPERRTRYAPCRRTRKSLGV
jgi:hypothetical protein